MTAPGSTLQDSVTRLCDEHMVEVGPREYVKMPALLDQLAQAVETGRSGGNGGGMGSPGNNDAIDLIRSMEGEATEYQYDLDPTWRGTLKDAIRYWARESIPGDTHAFLERVLLGWCDEIEALLHPKKPRQKMPLACPSCSTLLYVEGEGEHAKTAYALSGWFWGDDENLTHPSLWDVSCAVCGARWKGDELKWLRSAFEAEMARDTPIAG